MQHTTYRRLHSSSFVLRLLSAKTSLRQTEQNESTLHEMLQIQLKVSSHFVEVTHSNSKGLLGISNAERESIQRCWHLIECRPGRSRYRLSNARWAYKVRSKQKNIKGICLKVCMILHAYPSRHTCCKMLQNVAKCCKMLHVCKEHSITLYRSNRTNIAEIKSIERVNIFGAFPSRPFRKASWPPAWRYMNINVHHGMSTRTGRLFAMSPNTASHLNKFDRLSQIVP